MALRYCRTPSVVDGGGGRVTGCGLVLGEVVDDLEPASRAAGGDLVGPGRASSTGSWRSWISDSST
jgi:hypothetical protein